MSDPIGLMVTAAGRAAMINAEGTGTRAVTVTHIGLGTGRYTPTPAQTDLVAEFKRLDSIAGSAANREVIDVKLLDESADAYEVGEMGLFLDDGTLFGVYSNAASALYQKIDAGVFSVSFYVEVVSIDATQIVFPTAEFATPAATEEIHGVLRLATPAEARAGDRHDRALTPALMRAAYEGLLVDAVMPVLPSVETDDGKADVFESDGVIVLSYAQSWIWRGLRRITTTDIPPAERSLEYDPDRQYHLRWHAPGYGMAQPAASYPNGRVVLIDITDAYNAGRADLGVAYDSQYDDMLIADCGARGGPFRVRRLINQARLRDRLTVTGTPTPLAANTSVIEGSVATDYAVRPFVSWTINFDSDDGGAGNPDHDTFVNLTSVTRAGTDYRVMRDHTRSITLVLFAQVD